MTDSYQIIIKAMFLPDQATLVEGEGTIAEAEADNPSEPTE